jgi:hypothetical protein
MMRAVWKAPVSALIRKLMRPLLIHSSSKALLDLPRRVVHIEYAERFDLGDGARLAIA